MGQFPPKSMVAKAIINAALFLIIIFQCVSATTHTVGGPSGWVLGSDVNNWASKTDFVTGDNLVFEYYKPDHNVIEVSEQDYAQCEIRSPIHTYDGGNTVIPLTNPGTRYFVSGNPSRCFHGLKIQIHVLLLTERLSSSPRAETGSPDATPNLGRRSSRRLRLSTRRFPPPPPSQGFRPPMPPPTEFHPTEFPPTEFPPTEFPPTEVLFTEFPPTKFPPTEVPHTEFPPTEFPPIEFPPTEFRPTEFPPTEFRPTDHNGNGALTGKGGVSYLVDYWYVLVLVLISFAGFMFWFIHGQFWCNRGSCGGRFTFGCFGSSMGNSGATVGGGVTTQNQNQSESI